MRIDTVYVAFRNAPTRAQPHPSLRDKCNFYFRSAYTAITLVLIAWFSAVSSHRWPFQCSHRLIQRLVESPLARRSSISSEGSLLFVVCPSRISTHSVSTSDTGALSVPLRRTRLAPSSFANEDDGTASSRREPRSKWRSRNRVVRSFRPFSRHFAQSADADHAILFFLFPLPPADPFADAIKGSDDDVQDGLVHIRIQQRNGRKTLTTVQGLSSEYDLKKIVRACKKVSGFPPRNFHQSFSPPTCSYPTPLLYHHHYHYYLFSVLSCALPSQPSSIAT